MLPKLARAAHRIDSVAPDSAMRTRPCGLLTKGRSRVTVFRMQPNRSARPIADNLQDDLLVLGAVVVMTLRGVLHEGSRFEANSRAGIELISGPVYHVPEITIAYRSSG